MSISRRKTKFVQSAASKKGRRESGLFTAEGVRVLEEARRAHVLPREVYFAPSQLNDRGLELVTALQTAGVSCQELKAKELEKLTETKTPQGIIGLFPIRLSGPEESFSPGTRRLLWCDGVSDPGNLGTLMRSAAGFGFTSILISGASAEPYNPKVVRGTAGAIFGLRIGRADTRSIVQEIADRDFVLVASDIEGVMTREILPKLKNKRVVLAVGSEASGLDERILAAATYRVRIPHEPRVESLNAAVAGSILMKDIYEVP
jgi:RNA methyltransferase, TrmH family